MTRRAMPWLAAGLVALPHLALGQAVAEPALSARPAAVRVGDHRGFGRMVFDFAVPTGFDVAEQAGRVLIVFSGAPTLAKAGSLPRNVRAIEGVDGAVTLDLVPGARLRTSRIGMRIVVDVLDPAPTRAVGEGAKPAGVLPSAADDGATPTADRPTPVQGSAPRGKQAAARRGIPAAAAPMRSPNAPTRVPGVDRPLQITAPMDAGAVGPRPVPAVESPPVQADAIRALALAPASPGKAPIAARLPPASATAGVAQVTADPAAARAEPSVAPTAAILGTATGAGLPAPVAPVQQYALPGPQPSLQTAPDAKPAVAARGSLLLPFEADVGAAAFRRGEAAMVVFDQRRPVDLTTPAYDPAYAGASVRLGHVSTILTIPLLPHQKLALVREAGGWRIALTDTDTGPPIVPVAAQDGMLFPVDRPGQVVSVADPLTGATILVGTLVASGPGLAQGRRAPGYVVAPSWLGVVIEPQSDSVDLRPTSGGFLLASPGIAPATEPPAMVAGPLTRRYDFQDLPVPALLQRLQAQTAASAAAPPRGRTPDRLAVAQSLLSLGLAAEAQAVLALVATEDPAAAADPGPIGLMAIAALLAGRSDEAAGLDDARLGDSDEVELWRGVRDAMRDTDPDAGRGLARLLPLASAYPAAIRDRLRPLVVEAAVATGQAGAAAAAMAATDPTLDYARGLRREREGDDAGALLAYDKLIDGRDQLMRLRAGVHATEVRLRTGQLSHAAAADSMERLAAGWRGDARELRARLRVAALRTGAHSFRTALDGLRETERLFPDQQPAIRTAMTAVFQAMLAQPETVPPLDLVTLTSDYAALLPDDAGGVQALLADKLAALDLPGRAGPVLATLMARAAPGPARAGIGARLALMQVESGEHRAALATLAASEAAELPESAMEQRTLLSARARAGLGEGKAATALLTTLGTAAADDLRATILHAAGDWSGSVAALSDLAAKALPLNGPLTDAMQDIVLRQATSAVQADDTALLADLRRRYATRISGTRAELFRLLTAEQLRSPADLPRAASELALARLVSNGPAGRSSVTK